MKTTSWAHSASLACVVASALVAAPAFAEQKPLWELGLGAAALNGPDYRGADQRSTFVLPFPYVVYRGRFLKAEGDGVRGLLRKTDVYEINVSVGGATPVQSHANARRGMPDLDPALEIGPSLNLTLAGGEHEATEWQLRLPVRAVLTSDFSSVANRGFVANPNLNVDVRHGIPGGWRLGASVGAMFADSDYNSYYYDVKPKFATPDRAAYDTGGGYAGLRASLSMTNRFGNVWVGSYVRYENVSHATFDSSPLVERDGGVSVGGAFAIIFAKSSAMVEE